MKNIHHQMFYEKSTGNQHEVAINFGWINPMSNGEYKIFVDGEVKGSAKSKVKAFDKLVELIKENDWSGICRITNKAGE